MPNQDIQHEKKRVITMHIKTLDNQPFTERIPLLTISQYFLISSYLHLCGIEAIALSHNAICNQFQDACAELYSVNTIIHGYTKAFMFAQQL